MFRLWRTSGKPTLRAHYLSLISFLGRLIVTLGMELTQIYPSVLSWVFWQDLPVCLLMHISSNSVHTLQEQARIWVLFDSESAGHEEQQRYNKLKKMLKIVLLKTYHNGILLEVVLCFLQPPQRSHQHTALHHRAGIGAWNLVRQGVHHWQSERESCRTCTPCCIK